MRHRFLVALLALASAALAPAQCRKEGAGPHARRPGTGHCLDFPYDPWAVERPARWANKATLTPEEVKAYEEERARQAASYPPKSNNNVGGDTWLDPGSRRGHIGRVQFP